jgi:probable F420-dependent oxidoreductase
MTMTEFGLLLAATEHTLQPVEIARLAESAGFDALFVGEHTHLPLAEHRYSNIGDEYKQLYDPFVFLTAAAAVTERLVLGTAVTLLTEHHPITLANEIATLDRISNGRVVLGIGTGWNVVEMNNFGLDFKDRWAIARERVLAMRSIWTNDVAEFHGRFVDFDPIWCWPKPVRAGGPPILIGGGVNPDVIARRVVDFGDGWIPLDGGHELEATMRAVADAATRAGRDLDPLNLTVGLGLMGAENVTAQRIEEVIAMGFGRVLFVLNANDRDRDLAALDLYTNLVAALR